MRRILFLAIITLVGLCNEASGVTTLEQLKQKYPKINFIDGTVADFTGTNPDPDNGVPVRLDANLIDLLDESLSALSAPVLGAIQSLQVVRFPLETWEYTFTMGSTKENTGNIQLGLNRLCLNTVNPCGRCQPVIPPPPDIRDKFRKNLAHEAAHAYMYLVKAEASGNSGRWSSEVGKSAARKGLAKYAIKEFEKFWGRIQDSAKSAGITNTGYGITPTGPDPPVDPSRCAALMNTPRVPPPGSKEKDAVAVLNGFARNYGQATPVEDIATYVEALAQAEPHPLCTAFQNRSTPAPGLAIASVKLAVLMGFGFIDPERIQSCVGNGRTSLFDTATPGIVTGQRTFDKGLKVNWVSKCRGQFGTCFAIRGKGTIPPNPNAPGITANQIGIFVQKAEGMIPFGFTKLSSAGKTGALYELDSDYRVAEVTKQAFKEISLGGVLAVSDYTVSPSGGLSEVKGGILNLDMENLWGKTQGVETPLSTFWIKNP